MKQFGFLISYIILVICQILLWNFFNFSQAITITILPEIILLISTRRGPIFTMVVAFITGFAVDFFAGGMLGLTSLALVPVGLFRNSFIRLTYGQELFSREEDISIRKYGWLKLIIATVFVNLIFLVIYVWADGAGMRPLYFNLMKIFLSLLLSVALSLAIAPLLCREDNSKWM